MCLQGKTDQHRVNPMWLAVVVVFLVCMMDFVNSTSNRAIRFNVPSGASTLQDQLVLAQNMCVLGLRGKSCGKSDSILKSGDYNDLLVAGNGYDRWTHQVKPQVIQSRAVSSIDTQVKSIFASMTSPREFFSQIYPINGQSSFFNGLYSHNSGVADIFSRYFEGSFNVHDSQMQYITHQVSSYDSLNATLLFKRIIEILPSNMDEALYQQVIDTFGDSVMTSVEYGGVVDSTVSVRQCFSDGNLESYVKNELSSVVSGSTST